jgi:hypothetical protein
LRRHLKILANNTNNRIVSENSQLKTDLNSTTSLAECIEVLCFHNKNLNSERAYKDFLQNATQVKLRLLTTYCYCST